MKYKRLKPLLVPKNKSHCFHNCSLDEPLFLDEKTEIFLDIIVNWLQSCSPWMIPLTIMLWKIEIDYERGGLVEKMKFYMWSCSLGWKLDYNLELLVTYIYSTKILA